MNTTFGTAIMLEWETEKPYSFGSFLEFSQAYNYMSVAYYSTTFGRAIQPEYETEKPFSFGSFSEFPQAYIMLIAVYLCVHTHAFKDYLFVGSHGIRFGLCVCACVKFKVLFSVGVCIALLNQCCLQFQFQSNFFGCKHVSCNQAVTERHAKKKSWFRFITLSLSVSSSPPPPPPRHQPC